jgi:phosphate transport system permease protein
VSTAEPTPASALTTRRGDRGDAVFAGLARASGIFVLLVIVAIAVFLAGRAVPALRQQGWAFFTTKTWYPDGHPPIFGIAALAFGTLLSSLLALVMAVPVALGAALFTTEIAPARIGRLFGYLVDLLAAVPSVVYGLWGVIYLVPRLVPAEKLLSRDFGFIPLFHSKTHTFGRSIFAASLVLAIMILPIIAAITREVFRQVPKANREAALALGATRWEAIRLAVIPYSRSGVVGAIMLGLGRALGETIAVALVLSSSFEINLRVFEPGGNTIAANIANRFGEAGALGTQALIASGLVLFAITLVVNVSARFVISRTGVGALAKP